MHKKRSTILAWLLCVICVVSVIIQLIIWIRDSPGRLSLSVLSEALVWNLLLPLAYSFLAALIIMHQPGNRVGWLMMIIALGSAEPVSTYLEHLPVSPQSLSPGLWLLFWLYFWGWIPSIFPLFLIPLNFPSGKPPSPRWGWVNRLAIGMRSRHPEDRAP